MKFSGDVSQNHRLRKIGKVKGNRDQSKLVARLHSMAGQDKLRDGGENIVKDRAFAAAISKRAGADMDRIRLHPLWHENADPTWFVVCHVDETGRHWCHADAILTMQGLVRGWIIRRKRKRAQHRIDVSHKTVFAVRLQRWWRRYLFRTYVSALRKERLAKCRIDICRIIRCGLARIYFLALWSEMIGAAVKIQKAVRRRNFYRIIKLLRQKRLLDAVLKVQRKFRDHRSWKQMVKWENIMVVAKANKLRDDYLFGTKTLEQAEALRKQTEALFNNGTSVFGRKIAFSQKMAKMLQNELEGVIEEGEKPPDGGVSLSDVAHVTKEDFWNLDAEEKDPNAIAIKLRECGAAHTTTLDLSMLNERGHKLVIQRWPFGLQGRKHGLFHITALYIHGQELAGMPIDMYRLTNITDLRLNDNRIKWILPEVSELKQLYICWLHGNLLTTLPGAIGECTSLYHLSVADNRLISLPGRLGYVKNLRELRIEGNPDLASPTLDIARSIARPPKEHWNIEIVMRYLRKMAEGESRSEIRLENMGMIKLPSVLQDFKKITLISLKGNRISDVPRGLMELPKLKTLNLDDNRLDKISKFVYQLTVLETLSLIRNRIKQKGLPIDSLVLLTQLSVLNLSLNLLLTPPAEVLVRDAQTIIDYLNRCKGAVLSNGLSLSSFRLKSLPAVDVDRSILNLDLKDNLLPEIPVEIFKTRGLTHLFLSSNLIHVVPPSVSRLERLVLLHLDANSLSWLPDELATLFDLTDLNISRNRLTSVPSIIGCLSNLRNLSLTHNSITELSPNLAKLHFLFDLNLSFNNIVEMPDVFDHMRNLRKLSLEGNRMELMPASVSNCESLTDLLVSKNRLRALSSAVSGLANLTRLKISDCSIRGMPDDLSKLVALEIVDLERNELEHLPRGLCTIPNLQTLRIKANFVTNIPPYIDGLSTVTLLDLSSNRLTMVCPELRYMSLLSSLNLSKNVLRCLPPIPPYFGPVIARLDKLEHLDVRNNRLTKLPLDMCDCPKLKTLLLEENLWTEDEGLERILDPNKREGAGEVAIRVLQAKGLAKMDGRGGLSDPFCILTFGSKKAETAVIRSNLNPKWDQEFTFRLDGNSHDPVRCDVALFDWDPDGSNDVMGICHLDITKDVLNKSKVVEGMEGGGGTFFWVPLTGEDDLGRAAQGQIEFAVMFRQLDGSLKSIQSYLRTLKRIGWTLISGIDGEKGKKKLLVQATPNGMIFETEKDELRDADEVDRMDQFRKWVVDWVHEERSKREAWEKPDVFFAPSGSYHEPWLTNKERYDVQFEVMREYMLKQAREEMQKKGKNQKNPWERFSKADADEILVKVLRDEFENLDLDDDD